MLLKFSRFSFSVPATLAFITVTSSNSDDEASDLELKSAKKKCLDINSIWERLNWSERRDRCNSIPDCVFVGRRFIGNCFHNSEMSDCHKNQSMGSISNDFNKSFDTHDENINDSKVHPLNSLSESASSSGKENNSTVNNNTLIAIEELVLEVCKYLF